ncbi:putative ribonuclease H-like domain-containing protein [Tanacetum coccineum]
MGNDLSVPRMLYLETTRNTQVSRRGSTRETDFSHFVCRVIHNILTGYKGFLKDAQAFMTRNKSFLTRLSRVDGGFVALGRKSKEVKSTRKVMGIKWIKRDFSVARTPQQNGVGERKNMTLIEAARTMLADTLITTTFGAEAVSKVRNFKLIESSIKDNTQQYILLPLLYDSSKSLEDAFADDANAIIFGSTKKSLCVKFESLMHKKFQMSSIGELTFSLGLQVMQRDDGIFISQDKYVADILKKFDFVTMKIASTPIETHKELLKDEEAEDVDVHLYRLMIGFIIIRVDTARHKLNTASINFGLMLLLSTSENEEMEITATINGRVKTITEASIRRYQKLEDFDGISTLPNTKFFEQLTLMGLVVSEFEMEAVVEGFSLLIALGGGSSRDEIDAWLRGFTLILATLDGLDVGLLGDVIDEDDCDDDD